MSQYFYGGTAYEDRADLLKLTGGIFWQERRIQKTREKDLKRTIADFPREEPLSFLRCLKKRREEKKRTEKRPKEDEKIYAPEKGCCVPRECSLLGVRYDSIKKTPSCSFSLSPFHLSFILLVFLSF